MTSNSKKKQIKIKFQSWLYIFAELQDIIELLSIAPFTCIVIKHFDIVIS